ncbi:inositol monophosphatase family protein [Candidatus Ishikawella capsulata]|nr:inositol monophosphatase family protein [Candidatus Ishikawaella capsulata]
MHPMLNIAVQAVRKAGSLILKNYELSDIVSNNLRNGDSVFSAINMALEDIIRNIIQKFYPNHSILTKENNNLLVKSKNPIWIIHPIDGSCNFMKRLPHFSVSLAFITQGRTEIAVIYDPLRNELFSAVRGQGTQLNSYRIRNNHLRNISSALFAIDCSLKYREYLAKYISAIAKSMNNIKNIDFRITGSTDLDLAYVAANRIDAYCGIGLINYNFIVGELLIQESGGLITDFNGSPYYKISNNILAGNTYIIKKLLLGIREKLC